MATHQDVEVVAFRQVPRVLNLTSRMCCSCHRKNRGMGDIDIATARELIHQIDDLMRPCRCISRALAQDVQLAVSRRLIQTYPNRYKGPVPVAVPLGDFV